MEDGLELTENKRNPGAFWSFMASVKQNQFNHNRHDKDPFTQKYDPYALNDCYKVGGLRHIWKTFSLKVISMLMCF